MTHSIVYCKSGDIRPLVIFLPMTTSFLFHLSKTKMLCNCEEHSRLHECNVFLANSQLENISRCIGTKL